jgi:membrane-associated phospholipid phosphatase
MTQPGVESYAVMLTDCGNITVVGPAVIACWLWLRRRWGAAAAWNFIFPVALGFAATVALKFVSRWLGGSFGGTAFALSSGAPSGHVEMISAAYGGLAVALLRQSRQPLSLLAGAAVVLLLTGVAITRVTLHAHTPGDVAMGLAIGGAAAVAVARGVTAPAEPSSRQVAELVGLLVCVTLAMQLSGLRIDSGKII